MRDVYERDHERAAKAWEDRFLASAQFALFSDEKQSANARLKRNKRQQKRPPTAASKGHAYRHTVSSQNKARGTPRASASASSASASQRGPAQAVPAAKVLRKRSKQTARAV